MINRLYNPAQWRDLFAGSFVANFAERRLTSSIAEVNALPDWLVASRPRPAVKQQIKKWLHKTAITASILRCAQHSKFDYCVEKVRCKSTLSKRIGWNRRCF